MRFTDGSAEPLFTLRNGNQMHMVRHQTIAPDMHIDYAVKSHRMKDKGLQPLASEGLPGLRTFDNLRHRTKSQAAHSPLHDVVRHVGRHDPCHASHELCIAQENENRNNSV